MAITLADFTKIWASTSPLTPYSFSDPNYQEGWNFIGSTPPARQMWDSIQKQNDEKLKYIVDNFLPLSGGTMTGNLTIHSTNAKVTVNDDNIGSSSVGLAGSPNDYCFALLSKTSEFKEPLLLLRSSEQSADPRFQLRAGDGTNTYDLVGKPDGTLNWSGNNVGMSNSFGVTLVNGDNISIKLVENCCVVFAKRGADCSVHMFTYWDANSTRIFLAGTEPMTISKSANSDVVTISRTSSGAIGLKIINGGSLPS